jgi:hypothetical protein
MTLAELPLPAHAAPRSCPGIAPASTCNRVSLRPAMSGAPTMHGRCKAGVGLPRRRACHCLGYDAVGVPLPATANPFHTQKGPVSCTKGTMRIPRYVNACACVGLPSPFTQAFPVASPAVTQYHKVTVFTAWDNALASWIRLAGLMSVLSAATSYHTTCVRYVAQNGHDGILPGHVRLVYAPLHIC